MSLIGKVYQSNQYGDMKILKLIKQSKFKANDVYEVEFIDTGYRRYAAISNIRKGEVEDRSSTKVKYFDAHNDLDMESLRTGNRNIYDNWQNLLRRCGTDPNYKDVTLSDEWKVYSNFKKFVLDPNNGYRENYKIEKDMLSPIDHPTYSTETCVYVPNFINTIIIDKKRDKTEKYSSGVSEYVRDKTKVAVRISILGKSITIGYYDKNDILLAFCAYKIAKESLFHLTAKSFMSKGKICHKAYNALINFKFYDLRSNRFSKEEIDSKMLEIKRCEISRIYDLVKNNFNILITNLD